jgi:glyoxylase-like metal-dependent hydrolase (beta-lactamase superfamily II)
MQEIADGIVVSTEFRRITVGAIATGRGLICVDVPPYPRDARLWRSLLLERFKQPIRLVVLTDAHRDRLLGPHWFDEARIIAHDATFAAMRSLPGSFIDQAADMISADSDERSTFSGVRLHYPRVTFSERMIAYIGDIPIPITAMPGPTPGNVWIHLARERVVFTGDSVVVGEPPYMSRTCSKEWLNGLTILRRPRFAADLIVPGRGPLTDKAGTLPISEFLRYLRRRVQNLYRAGRPRADVLEILPDALDHLTMPHMLHRIEVEARVRAGLEAIYDEFQSEEQQQEESEEDALLELD